MLLTSEILISRKKNYYIIMEYLKIKRKIHAVCVMLCLLFTVNSSLLAELSYAQATRLSLELSNVAISDVFTSVEKK